MLFKLAFAHRFEALSLVTYLTMGWLSLIVIYQLVTRLEAGGVTLLAIGGVVYTTGVIFYASSASALATPSGTPSCSAAAPAISWRSTCTSKRCRYV